MELSKLVFKKEQFRLALVNATKCFNEVYQRNHGCAGDCSGNCTGMCAAGCAGCCFDTCESMCVDNCATSTTSGFDKYWLLINKYILLLLT